MNHRIERKTLRVNAGAPACELTTGSCCGDAIGPTTPATVVTRRKLWLPPGSQLVGDPFCVDVPNGNCCDVPSADGASGIRLTKQRVLVPAWALAGTGCEVVEDCAEACVRVLSCSESFPFRIVSIDDAGIVTTLFTQPEITIPQFLTITYQRWSSSVINGGPFDFWPADFDDPSWELDYSVEVQMDLAAVPPWNGERDPLWGEVPTSSGPDDEPYRFRWQFQPCYDNGFLIKPLAYRNIFNGSEWVYSGLGWVDASEGWFRNVAGMYITSLSPFSASNRYSEQVTNRPTFYSRRSPFDGFYRWDATVVES